jgi:hypothetical protein
MVDPTTIEAAIRPFCFTALDEDLDDLRGRIDAMRWREQETVAG